MKKTLISILCLGALCITATACGAIDNIIANADDDNTYTNVSSNDVIYRNGNGRTVTGSGNIVTRTMSAQKYDAVKASRCVKVILAEDADKITISADDNFIDHVQVRFEGGTLVATLDNKLNSIRNPHITVTAPFRASISSLTAESSAAIDAQGTITADLSIDASSSADITADVRAVNCDINVSSSADVDCELYVSRCKVDAGSAADVTLHGTASTLDVGAGSSADVDIRDFTSSDATLSAGSAADLTCDLTTGTCDVRGGSSADITLSGRVTGKFSVGVNSAAGVDASDFTATDCTVEASSGAHATVNASGKLFRASATTGASVTNLGHCDSNDITKSTGGSVSYNR